MGATSKTGSPSGAKATANPPNGPEELLARWARGVRILHVAHGMASERYATFGRTTRVVAAVLTAIVGTALFVSAAASEQDLVRTVAAILSLLAAVLGVAQIALDYPDLAVRHRQAFVEYGRLRRRLDILLSTAASSPPADRELEAFRESWAKAEESAPVIPVRLRSAARRTIDRADKRNKGSQADDSP
jgi:hypothetical protein